MKGRILSGVTPQDKMVAVNNRFGNTNIKGQQGTTRVLWDSISLDGRTELRFFENASSKQYPYTNIGSEGNRLSVGDTFVVQKIYFGLGQIVEERFEFVPGLDANTCIGEFNFQIANSQVIKQLPLSAFYSPELNPTSVNLEDVALETFTDIVIPPLLEYVASVRLANSINLTKVSLFCFIEGSAGIISPQTTF